jgi:hypothetical protein
MRSTGQGRLRQAGSEGELGAGGHNAGIFLQRARRNRDNRDHLRYRVARVPAIQLEKLVVEARQGRIRNQKVNFPIAG